MESDKSFIEGSLRDQGPARNAGRLCYDLRFERSDALEPFGVSTSCHNISLGRWNPYAWAETNAPAIAPIIGLQCFGHLRTGSHSPLF